MNEFTGMLWFDNSKSALEEKIKKALAEYAVKYKPAAELCLVNVKSVEGVDLRELSTLCNITVSSSKLILPNHFWIGVSSQLELLAVQK